MCLSFLLILCHSLEKAHCWWQSVFNLCMLTSLSTLSTSVLHWRVRRTDCVCCRHWADRSFLQNTQQWMISEVKSRGCRLVDLHVFVIQSVSFPNRHTGASAYVNTHTNRGRHKYSPVTLNVSLECVCVCVYKYINKILNTSLHSGQTARLWLNPNSSADFSSTLNKQQR